MDRHEIHRQLKLKGKLAFDSSFASISKRRLQGIEFRNSPNAIRVKAEHLDDLWLNRARGSIHRSTEGERKTVKSKPLANGVDQCDRVGKSVIWTCAPKAEI